MVAVDATIHALPHVKTVGWVTRPRVTHQPLAPPVIATPAKTGGSNPSSSTASANRTAMNTTPKTHHAGAGRHPRRLADRRVGYAPRVTHQPLAPPVIATPAKAGGSNPSSSTASANRTAINTTPKTRHAGAGRHPRLFCKNAQHVLPPHTFRNFLRSVRAKYLVWFGVAHNAKSTMGTLYASAIEKSRPSLCQQIQNTSFALSVCFPKLNCNVSLYSPGSLDLTSICRPAASTTSNPLFPFRERWPLTIRAIKYSEISPRAADFVSLPKTS